MTTEEKIKEIIQNQLEKISNKDMFSVEECMQEYGEWIKEQLYTENGANDMCQYWYNKGIEEAIMVMINVCQQTL